MSLVLSIQRRGNAPLVETFTGDDREIRFDDWLSSLEHAAAWYKWTPEECLIQLAGHLKGRAHQEWILLAEAERNDYEQAVAGLRSHLDPSSKALAAQDFCHSTQGEQKEVTDYICRVEKTFRLAYGSDGFQPETKDALLFGQLQEGLRQDLMESPAVSGATNYQSLCLAMKIEERRQATLRQRKLFRKPPITQTPSAKDRDGHGRLPPHDPTRPKSSQGFQHKRCYQCGQVGHLAKSCRRKPKEGTRMQQDSHARAVHYDRTSLDWLFSSSEDEDTEVRQVRVKDTGSHSHCVKVSVQGVPAYGLIDSGADITIVGGPLHCHYCSPQKA